MGSNGILVSLCFPTCNRGQMIKSILDHYLSCSEFDCKVEIVISDNASTDSTKQLVTDYILDNPTRHIRYYRNDTNIGTLNFFESMKHAQGKYIKLCNDYLYIDDEGLKTIKDFVAQTPDNVALFFYDNLRERNNGCVRLHNVDKFIHLVNNKMTWISNFGCWKRDILTLEAYTKSEPKVNGHIIQTAFWSLFLVDSYEETIIVDFHSNHCLPVPNSKRVLTYNFFTPHVVYYYDLIDDYVKQGKVTKQTILLDKERLLSDFVGNKIVEYLILRRNCPYDLSGSWSLIFKYFGKIPYFYYIIPRQALYAVLYLPLRKKAIWFLKKMGIFEQCKKLLKK